MLKTLMISLTILLLAVGCQPKRKAPDLNFPHDPNPPVPNCAADGSGCKQYNPNKPKAPDHNPPFDPNPPAPNCAADGPGCKQFNPNKP